jgi:hypothetical protein
MPKAKTTRRNPRLNNIYPNCPTCGIVLGPELKNARAKRVLKPLEQDIVEISEAGEDEEAMYLREFLDATDTLNAGGTPTNLPLYCWTKSDLLVLQEVLNKMLPDRVPVKTYVPISQLPPDEAEKVREKNRRNQKRFQERRKAEREELKRLRAMKQVPIQAEIVDNE